MKPIHLKIAGLQSYRQMQEIDFSALTEMGLFGIFGPTGSGKSTILDAITLAMYGKVGRALGGTQGIMNQSEDALFVSFTFELTSAKGKERYRVERRFKRTNELSISNTISRFIAVTEQGETVVADKLADVTKCVEQKIGLKLDDFTRAVVLPQGKFAEFLSLKGVDRRAMLQRLFHLEQYGDVLGQKVNRYVKEHEQQLRELQAEQQGLGAASFEQVEVIDSSWQLAVMYTKERQKVLEQAQQQLQQLTLKRQWSRDLEQALAQRNNLQQKQAEVDNMQMKLTRANEATALKLPLTTLKQLQQQVSTLELGLQQATASLETANKERETTSAALKEAKEQLAQNEPQLLQRIEQLEQAQLLEKECVKLQDESLHMKAQLADMESKRQQAQHLLSKEEQLLVKAQHRKVELEQQALLNEVKPLERKQAQEALREEQAAIQLSTQLEALAKEEQLWSNKALEIQKQMATLQAEQVMLNGQLKETLQQLHDLMGQQIKSKTEVKAWQIQLQTVQRQLQQLSEHEQKLRWASQLASGLIVGEPCLVCGSVHHPALANSEQLEVAHHELQAQFNDIQSWAAEFNKLEYRYERSVEQLVTLIESITELEPIEGLEFIEGMEHLQSNRLQDTLKETAVSVSSELNSPHSEESEAQAKFIPFWTKELVACGEQLHQFEQQCSAQQAVIAQWIQTTKQIQVSWRKLAQTSLTIVSEQSAVEQKGQELADQKTLLQEQLQQYQHILAQLPLQSSQDGSDKGPATLRWEEIERRDIDAEDIKERLARSLPFIEETTAKIGQLKDGLIELDKHRVQLSTQLEGKSELLEEKQARLKLWSQGQAVAPLLTDVQQQLVKLRFAAKTSEEKYELALKNFHERSTGHGIAEQALASVKDQWQRQVLVWEKALAESPFKDEAEVMATWMESEQISQYTAQIEQHLNLQRELEVTIKDLQSRLGKERVDEAMWQQKQAEVEQAKSDAELAVRHAARLERDLEDIKLRHTRWQQLEEQKIKLEHKHNLLVKLQTSLRGNAFVEYIAEEQLMNVSRSASERLKFLTNQRYALESDSGGGFVIRDDANGGVRRPVGTLSGGETFLTSLALALALSAQIQLRGQYPLQFFFLDEGFGTLDPELLDTVITSLEHLHHEHLAVGIISHVADLRARLPRKLVVVPAESGGDGSKIVLEKL
ncbi:exonuclease SbcC [Paenibacillus turicensis]|uniref:Nuclease SbcCD subunit C n=1 Tax=Paenibacillus turicensis TaxID=160487 RepID=A0ABS4FP04_9BACL|nr:AAA family ATPase [Paenibacillus turicensis]MBP1904313.1 exonuclease SbcC [Paenibacillus turicensis]